MDLKGINAIIFDLGKVIVDLDKSATLKAFEELGSTNLGDFYNHTNPDPIFRELELGALPYEVFRMELSLKMNVEVSESDFDNAWFAMLGEITQARVTTMAKLSQKYPLFLLSNTNEAHMQKIYANMGRTYPSEMLFPFFTQEYYSHFTERRKPEPGAFDLILREQSLDPATTLFIDDEPSNIDAAERIGIKTYLFKEGDDISTLFDTI